MMKRIQIYFIAIITLGLAITGCNNLEDSESSSVDGKPTTSITVTEVADSVFTLDLATDAAGYIGYVLSDDTTISVEALNIISGNLEGDVVEVGTYKVESPGGESIKIGGLMPNTFYKVFAASSNVDGVESDVEYYILKTDDGLAPTLIGASPSPSDEASVAIGEALSFTFDEPVLINTSKNFTFEYIYEGVTEVVSGAEVIVDGSSIIVPQTYDSYAGDIFILSWEAGAVTDLSGNEMGAITSSYDIATGDGSMLYYRSENVDFALESDSITPKSGSVIANHDFTVDITFPFSISLLEEITSDMITFKYTDWKELSVVEISAYEGISIVNDSTLRIEQSYMPKEGDMIELSIAEGVIEDAYNNTNSASEYVLNWTLGDFHVENASFTPSTDSVLRVQSFTVKAKFDFPISLVTGATGSIYYRIIDKDEYVLGDLPITATVDATNDSVLLLPTPMEIPNFTRAVLMMDEGVIADDKGNVNLEMGDVISWAVEPELAKSIDVLYGTFSASNSSLFDGTSSPMTDIVISAYDSSPTDTVWIVGLLGGTDSVKAGFDLATAELSIPPYQSLGATADGGDLYTLNHPDIDADNVSRGNVLVNGDVIMTWGALINGGPYSGYFYDVYDSFWTKGNIVSKSTQLKSSIKLTGKKL